VETSWPPRSPREALLSSPSGRRRFQEMQARRGQLGSPLKRSSTAPNFRAQTEQVLGDGVDQNREGDEEDEDEDEETLKLKLAAIEARLKLKQLQKSRARSAISAPGADVSDASSSRPATSSSLPEHDTGSLVAPGSPRMIHGRTRSDEVQVPVSPLRRAPAPADPVSPRRYLLGIDKGLKGKDVSLKRPPSSRGLARSGSKFGLREGALSRTSDDSHEDFYFSPREDPSKRIKSFSERIAETRQLDKSRRERAEQIQANRSSAFQFDKAEMEAFKATAAETMQKNPRTQSPTRARPVETFSREEVMRSLQQHSMASLKRSNTAPSVQSLAKVTSSPNLYGNASVTNRRHHRSNSTARTPLLLPSHSFEETGGSPEKAADSSKFEPHSSMNLSSRILPHSFLTRTLTGKKILQIPDLLKSIKAPDFELPPEIDGDYVVFGIVASKSSPKEVKGTKNATDKEADRYDDGLNNTNKYMAITLTDLQWSIDLFLFDTAFPRYYKLSEGVLIAILNPTIMPPPKHKLDTNRFSLAISSSDDKILEIGFSKDIGFCKAVRKDGKTCQSWVDARKTEFCDFHTDLQVRRTQSQRMGVNGGPGMLGPGGLSGSRTGFFGGKRTGDKKTGLKAANNAQYDAESQSVYYVAPGPRSRNTGGASYVFNHSAAGQSASSLIDADEDPFIAAGMMGRGMENKEERMRRRLAEQAREREIAKKLVSSRGGGVGAEYLRAKVTSGEANGFESPRSALVSNSGAIAAATPSPMQQNASSHQFGLGGFRRADTIRLGPKKRAYDGDRPGSSGVKKTRFITARGIKEAGRDSLGGASDTAMKDTHTNDDDDDDELDII
ncbi:hypothetical protein ASPZODRAFT_127567, partial [Penicilliopsis zonata CBS 506.65]